MRTGICLVIGVVLLGGLACKKEGASRASLEQKLENYLDKQLPKQGDWTLFDVSHTKDPRVARQSEKWSLKTTEMWGAKKEYKYAHEVNVTGVVVSAGGLTPNVFKGITIALTQGGFDLKNTETGSDILSTTEADRLLQIIDRGIKVTNQVTKGGAEKLYFSNFVTTELSINGHLAKDPFNETAASEWVLTIGSGKATVPLRSGDWMELKLKIEAAKKWLETQEGDLAILANEPTKK